MSKRILILLLIISLVILTFCTKKSTSPEEQLLPPTNLTISLVENNKIQLTWIDNSTNEIKVIIDWKRGVEDWYENYNEVSENITIFNDIIPTNSDTIYSYRLKAFDGEEYSAYSDTIAWFSTNSAPSNLQLEQIAQDSLQLTWQDNSMGEQYFRIDRKIDEKGWQMDYAHVPADTTHFLDYTTALYDTCNYKIFAVTGISHSDSTENAFIPFLPAPNNLELQALSATEVKLTWKDNCHNEEGYRIYIKRGETAIWDSINIAVNIQEVTDYNVTPGIINYYKVCAYYENDTSGFIEDEINTLPAPSNLICTQQNVHTFELIWNDNSEFEQGFKIDKKVGVGIGEWQISYAIVGESIQEWTDENAEINDNLMYRIHAYCGNNVSDYATSQEIDNTFPAPNNISYQKIDIATIKLNWTDNSVGEQGFKIDKKVGDGDWEIEYAILDADIVQWFDWTAEINEMIQYRVYAYYEDAVSDYAITDEIDNAIPAPSNFAYEILSPTSVKLTWDDNSIGEQGFKIDKKVGDDLWQTEYAILDDNITEWVDDNVLYCENIYRLYVYYQDYISSYVYLNIFIPFMEDFSGGTANNFVFEDVRWYVSISNLVMEGWENNTWASTYFNQELKDYTVETRIGRIASNETLGYTFGLFFRSNGFLSYDSKSSDGYLLSVAANATYSVWKIESGVETTIIDWTATPNIGYGLYAFTKIKVVVNGSNFDIYFNDIYTDSFADATFPTGYVGLVTYDSVDGDNEVWWQYFALSAPEVSKGIPTHHTHEQSRNEEIKNINRSSDACCSDGWLRKTANEGNVE